MEVVSAVEPTIGESAGCHVKPLLKKLSLTCVALEYMRPEAANSHYFDSMLLLLRLITRVQKPRGRADLATVVFQMPEPR